jgi:glycosyltransferase involved in cell wall biosynthesis
MISILINALLYTEKVRSGANLQLEKLFFEGPVSPDLKYHILFNRSLSDEKLKALQQIKGLIPVRIDNPCQGIINRHFQTKEILRDFCREKSISLYHTFHLPLLKMEGTKTLLTIHDMRHAHTPYTSVLKKLIARCYVPFHLKIADQVITVSEYSKEVINRYYQVPLEKIRVIPNGIVRNEKAGKLKQEKIICSVGHFEERKNQLGLIQAFQDSVLAKEYQLYLIGRINDENYYNKCLGEKSDRIRFLVDAGEEQKNEIYSRAELAVLPSRYEGFGITLLEAMEFNLKIIASDIPAFREIAGSSICYFKDSNRKDLENKLNQVPFMPLGHYSPILTSFDWLASKNQLEKLYFELGNQNS